MGNVQTSASNPLRQPQQATTPAAPPASKPATTAPTTASAVSPAVQGPVDQGPAQAPQAPTAQTSLVFVEAASAEPSFEERLSQIKQISTTADKDAQIEIFFNELLDEHDYGHITQLLEEFNSKPELQEKLYDQMIQELLEEGKYNQALEINQNFSNTGLKDKTVEYIVRFLVEQGETFAAAQAAGEGNISGVLKAEWQSAMHTVEQKYDRVVDSIKDLFRKESLAEQLAEEAVKDIGNQYRHKYLDYGNLACAHTVSRVLDNFPDLTSVDSNEVNDLVRQLKAEGGFQQVAGDARKPKTPVGKVDYQPGDVVVFSRGKKAGYGHVGIVSRVREDGTVMMVHNSSSRRQVVEIPLLRYKTPTGVFRLGE